MSYFSLADFKYTSLEYQKQGCMVYLQLQGVFIKSICSILSMKQMFFKYILVYLFFTRGLSCPPCMLFDASTSVIN